MNIAGNALIKGTRSGRRRYESKTTSQECSLLMVLRTMAEGWIANIYFPGTARCFFWDTALLPENSVEKLWQPDLFNPSFQSPPHSISRYEDVELSRQAVMRYNRQCHHHPQENRCSYISSCDLTTTSAVNTARSRDSATIMHAIHALRVTFALPGRFETMLQTALQEGVLKTSMAKRHCCSSHLT